MMNDRTRIFFKMVFYSLKLANWNIKYTPLNSITKDYPYCDSNGNILEKVTGHYEKSVFINPQTQQKHDTAFRLINNKPYAKLLKTKEVTTFKEVEISEVEDLLQERLYLAENDELYYYLSERQKAIKFGFTNGNGFKVYKAYLYPSKIYKGFLLMSLGTTQISELITEIAEIKAQQKKADSISLILQGLDRAKIEDLIEI